MDDGSSCSCECKCTSFLNFIIISSSQIRKVAIDINCARFRTCTEFRYANLEYFNQMVSSGRLIGFQLAHGIVCSCRFTSEDAFSAMDDAVSWIPVLIR